MAQEEPGLLMVVVEVDPEHEEEFNRWYDTEHIPEKLAAPGFRSARRFRDHERPGRYLALYELDDAPQVLSPEYMTQPVSEWTRRVTAAWKSLDRAVWIELPPPSGEETS